VAAEKAAAARESAETEPGTVADVHYDFTQFGLDRSQATLARTLRTSLIVDPKNGKLPPISEEGKRVLAARAEDAKRLGGRWDSAQSNQLDDRCLIMAGPGPPMMDAAYNSNYHIVQAPGYVMILTEMIHDVRVIPLDGRPQPSSNVRQWMGVSRGRWEGDTLVVETTNLIEQVDQRYAHSEKAKIIERYRMTKGAKGERVLVAEMTMTDPVFYKEPVKAEKKWAEVPNGHLLPYECAEEAWNIHLEQLAEKAKSKK
jgi:hypothetical protein